MLNDYNCFYPLATPGDLLSGGRSTVYGGPALLLRGGAEKLEVGGGPAVPCRAVPGPARPGARPPPGRYQKLKIKLLFCRDLIASVHAATQEVCFLWVSVPKSR